MPSRLDSLLRRLVPAVPRLSHNRLLMLPLDLLDQVIAWPLGLSRVLPPNRFRIRIGVGNRLLFNQVLHVQQPVGFWMATLARGAVTLDARILDVGCGCGRYAATLRDLDHFGSRFAGHYLGLDVDEAMVRWCRAHFPEERFAFEVVAGRSAVYRPDGETGAPPLPVEDDDRDFIFGNSLLTHLLEDDTRHMFRECRRVLRDGGEMHMTVFCLDHLAGRLGGRWTFRHRRGAAAIESERYPEAAVAYDASFLETACRDAGFESVELIAGDAQSLLRRGKVPPMSRRAVILLSGGLDSATALAAARDRGFVCHALTVRYGQRHACELDAAAAVAKSLGAVEHKVVDIDLRAFGGSALTDDIDVPKDRGGDEIATGIPITYVPARNTIFLSYALAYAEVLGARDIVIGVNAVDYSGYPDCRPDFIAAFEKLANLATKIGVEGESGDEHIRVHAPLIDLTKAQIIRRGMELGVDYGLTHSCYDPDERGRPCGRCDSCLLRAEGFAEAGIEDPRRL